MAIRTIQEETLTSIGDAIREVEGTSELIPVVEMSDRIRAFGDVPTYDEGYEAGKQSEYDRFWDEFQSEGNRTVYLSAFSGQGWSEKNFKPKYDMIVVGSMSSMFYASVIRADLVELLEKAKVKFDTSRATSLNSAFNSTQLTRVGIISCEGVSSGSGCYQIFIASTKLHTIEKFIIRSDGSQKFTDAFKSCSALENIVIEGVIGQNGFSVQDSPKLSKASITSIINALSSTTTGLTVTLSKTAVNTAFETSTGAADGSTSAEWVALAATKSNWTIALA